MFEIMKEEPTVQDPLPIETPSEVKREPADPGTSRSSSPNTGMYQPTDRVGIQTYLHTYNIQTWPEPVLHRLLDSVFTPSALSLRLNKNRGALCVMQMVTVFRKSLMANDVF